MSVYYNEIDERAAAWLRELIKRGVLADGEVDTRSIVDVRSADLSGFTRCHFFAGIGGWEYALQLAGWPDGRTVWTGSCPCQPFSVAGAGKGADDPRHLWPAWFPLICERRPSTVFGEQTASEDGRHWLDLVLSQMEGIDYAIGAFDLPACSVGSPQRRQRLWFVADDYRHGRAAQSTPRLHADGQPGDNALRRGADGVLADAGHRERGRSDDGRSLDGKDSTKRSEATDQPRGRRGVGHSDGRRRRSRNGVSRDASGPDEATRRDASGDGIVGEPASEGSQGRTAEGSARSWNEGTAAQRTGAASFWEPCDWIPCIDGKARPVEPGSFPLAHGIPARVGRLRGYGNAIVPEVAAEVISAYLEVKGW